MYLQKDVDNYYPGASIYEAMEIWSLPKNKKHMIEEICANGKYFAQKKKDGNWYEYSKSDTTGESYLFSRGESVSTGLPVEAIEKTPHIKEAFAGLPNGTVIIGEIYYPNETSNEVRSIMGCGTAKALLRQKEKGNIHFYLHDILRYNGKDLTSLGAYERYEELKRICEKYNLLNDYIELAEIMNDPNELYNFLIENLANGEEGSVLKKKDQAYAEGKRPAWSMIKWKKQDDVDMVCMGFEDATREYTGGNLETWPYWQLENGTLTQGNYHKAFSNATPVTKPYFHGWKTAIRIGLYDDNGELKSIGTVASGLTDELREEFAKNPQDYIGKVLICNCMEITKDSLRHPIFMGFRDDKNAKNCKMSDVFK